MHRTLRMSSPEDIPKTAVITPSGQFEFESMEYGLRNASHTFPRCDDPAFADISFVFGFIDDLLVESDTGEEHRTHLRIVFE